MNKMVVLIALTAMFSCKEQVPNIIISDKDSAKVISNDYKLGDDYDGEIPGLDAKVIDYTLPNPYQHKSQLLFDSTVATSWDKAGFPNAKRFIMFFKDFQLDVKHENKEKVADLIKFPLKNYRTREEFLSNYDSIFMTDFTYEVLTQDPMEIYRDEKGAMIGDDGQLWFKDFNGSYKIIAVNP